MKKYLKKISLAISAAMGGFLAGCVLWQKYIFWQAKKNTPSPEHEIFASSGGSMAYTSKGRGRPLLLIHSMFLGTNRQEWDCIVDDLAKSYHVYALDLPGFGNSFYPSKPWTAYDYVHCIHEFWENVIGRPTCILAANGGADFALMLSKLYPEMLRGMILVSPQGIGNSFATNGEVAPLHKLLLPLAGTQLFLMATGKRRMQTYLEDFFFAKESISKEMVQAHSKSARQTPKAQVTFASLETGFWQADTKTALAHCAVPLWIIWGEENKKNPISNMEAARELCPQGDFTVFEDTGAFPHIENNIVFHDLVKEFLR